jgi:DNA polymerase-3 subunit beta
MAKNDVRYYLNGVHFMLHAGKLRLTATDGHRLHRAWIELPDAELTDNAEGIIAAQSVARLVEVAERHVDVSLEASSGRFNIVDREVALTKLIDGKFPDADASSRQTGRPPAACRAQSFLAAVRRVAQILAGDKITGMRFAFSTGHSQPLGEEHRRRQAQRAFSSGTPPTSASPASTSDMDMGLRGRALDALTGDWAFAHLPARV